MSESITNSPPQVIEHLILSVISGLGEQLHVESHLSRYVLELLKPSLFIPLEASMFTANQLTLSRAALVIVANHVGVPKLLQTLISRCTDLDADKDLGNSCSTVSNSRRSDGVLSVLQSHILSSRNLPTPDEREQQTHLGRFKEPTRLRSSEARCELRREDGG